MKLWYSRYWSRSRSLSLFLCGGVSRKIYFSAASNNFHFPFPVPRGVGLGSSPPLPRSHLLSHLVPTMSAQTKPKGNSMADQFLKDLVDAEKSNQSLFHQQKPPTSAPAGNRTRTNTNTNTNTVKARRLQQEKLEERKRLKSAATAIQYAQQREASLFPDASPGLGASLHLMSQAKNANARRRTASANSGSRFLRSRGHLHNIFRDTPDQFRLPGESHHDVDEKGDAQSSDLYKTLAIDQSTTLLQLRAHDELEQAHFLRLSLNSTSMSTSSPREPHEKKNMESEPFDEQYGTRDLYEAYAFTVAKESKLRQLTLEGDDKKRNHMLTELRAKLAVHIDKANQLLSQVIQASSDNTGDEEAARLRAQATLAGTYTNIITKREIDVAKKNQVEKKEKESKSPKKENPLVASLQKIAAAQRQQNELLQHQRLMNTRLERVLTYATPREEKVVHDRKQRTIEIRRLEEKRKRMLERRREGREHVMHLKKQVKEMKRLLVGQREEMSKVRIAWEMATGSTKHSDSWGRKGLGQMLTDNATNEVTSRDLDTTSPDHMKEIRRERFLMETKLESSEQENVDNDDDDDEDKAWKQEQEDILIPQDYVDAQFREKMKLCAKIFEVIVAEATSISKCDVCKKIIDTPHIARGCSHCFCLQCLPAGSDSDDENVSDDHQEEPENQSGGKSSKEMEKEKSKSFVDVRVVCPVCEMKTEVRADNALAAVLQKLHVFAITKK